MTPYENQIATLSQSLEGKTYTARNFVQMMITSTDHAGRPCILTHNGTPVNQGEILEDFRGDQARILGGQAPHKPSSTGQIHTSAGNFYPSVFGCQWTPQED